MTPRPALATLATLAVLAAAAPATAATRPDCGADALHAATRGTVAAYYPSRCYDAARAKDPSPATDGRLQTARTRDLHRKLFSRVTGFRTTPLGSAIRLHVTTTLPVRNLRIEAHRLGPHGSPTIWTGYLNGRSRTVTLPATTRGRMLLRLRLGFVLRGKVFGAAWSPRLAITVE